MTQHPLPMPNGSDVWDGVSNTLKGYAVRDSRNEYIAYDAARYELGRGTMSECFTLLNTPEAKAVADDVHRLSLKKGATNEV